jgi:poly-gamma-glutamate synthesis protein (capsule biosynthesis protein)
MITSSLIDLQHIAIYRLLSLAVLIGISGLLGPKPLSAQEMSAKKQPIPDDVWSDMRRIWKEKEWKLLGCPERKNLTLITVPYIDFNGNTKSGKIIVATDVSDEVASSFTEIFKSRKFRIQRMELVHLKPYLGNDDRSMKDNNTSAFNCRPVGGTNQPSSHALGTAIDINPELNPMVRRGVTSPATRRATNYNTSVKRMKAFRRGEHGLIIGAGVVIAAFKKRDWKWGGEWRNFKDYQHISKDGR